MIYPNTVFSQADNSGTGPNCIVTWNSTGVSWYNTDRGGYQFNYSNETYCYLAIG